MRVTKKYPNLFFYIYIGREFIVSFTDELVDRSCIELGIGKKMRKNKGFVTTAVNRWESLVRAGRKRQGRPLNGTGNPRFLMRYSLSVARYDKKLWRGVLRSVPLLHPPLWNKNY